MADLVTDSAADLEGILRDSCAHLARSLDLLSRVVHQPRPGEIGAISVRESLTFVADLQRAGRTSARLEITADPGLAPVAGTQRHLEHALLALVIHSLDRLRTRETAAVRVSARQERERVDIMVGDSGGVLPVEEQARLFQLLPGVDPAQQPLAVSLMAAREVIRLCGGTLTYTAASAGESGFLISLPVWQG